MPEEFEKNIQKKLQDFNLEPSHQVWSEIDAALSEKKRRRFVFWWWLLPVILVVGTGVWLYVDNNGNHQALKNTVDNGTIAQAEKQKNSEEKNEKIQSDSGNSLAGNKQESGIQQNDSVINQPKDNTLSSNSKQLSLPVSKQASSLAASQQKKELVKANNKIITRKDVSLTRDAKETRITSINIETKDSKVLSSQPAKKIDGLKATTTPNDATAQVTMPAAIESKKENTISPGDAKDLKPLNASADSLSGQSKNNIGNIVPQRLAVTNDSAVSNAVSKKIKANTANKTHWHFIVGGGITSTNAKSGSKLASSSSFDDITSPSTPSNGNTNGGSSRADSTGLIVKPQAGYHLLAGVSYERSLSKRWKISGGVQYRFLSNTQKVGRGIDSTLKVLAQGAYAASLNLASVNNFNYAGYSATVTNTAHWLEIPVTIEYTLNPSNKTKYYLDAGASYAWMVASKWLIPDSRYSKLYYNNDFLNHHILNWQLGLGVNTISGWKFGLKYQQSSTTVAEKFIEPHLRWQNISFYTGIPLNIKRHSTK